MNLETLSLHGCKKVTVKSMHEVAELTRLTSLDVGSTKIHDDGAVAISRLPNLTSLRMAGTWVGVAGYEALGRMPALTTWTPIFASAPTHASMRWAAWLGSSI